MPKTAKGQILFITILIGAIASFHHLIPTEPHSYHKIHNILRKLYLLPPLLAAAWLGLRGSIVTTITVTILFLIHIFLDWPGEYMEQTNQIGEIAGLWVAGLVPGWLFDRQRAILKKLANSNEETLLGLISALDLREHNTGMHSQRVRDYTELIAEQIGIPEKEKRIICFGALLHDIGKIAIPDHILLKPGKLTDAEWSEMRKHPDAGYQIVKRISFLKEAAEIVYCHHEQFDGNGYPRGLRGDSIPLGARMFMVADAYDALTSNRPYHSLISYSAAIDEIKEHSGSHFDPLVVNAFIKIDPKKILAIAERYKGVE